MLAPDTILQNRYRIVRQLGEGGMGTVYEAVALRLDTTVALKQTRYTDERMMRQFEREARLLARLRHPALPRVIDHFEEGHGLFLVMDFIEGDDLSEMLRKRGVAFPVKDVLKWADQLLDALTYLHSQDPPVIHRDIKPQNLKLSDKGQIVLLDFGLAKGFAESSIFGYTRHYAPLEQMHGTGTDLRSDLYSLAATLYHFLTGVIPPDSSSRALANSGELPDPLRPANELNPQVSAEISAALMKGLALHPNKRFSSADIMKRALQQAKYNETPAASPLTPTILLGSAPKLKAKQPIPIQNEIPPTIASPSPIKESSTPNTPQIPPKAKAESKEKENIKTPSSKRQSKQRENARPAFIVKEDGNVVDVRLNGIKFDKTSQNRTGTWEPSLPMGDKIGLAVAFSFIITVSIFVWNNWQNPPRQSTIESNNINRQLPISAPRPLLLTGDVTGRITSLTSENIQDMFVTLTHSTSGLRVTSTTDSMGYFSFKELSPGLYKLETNKVGFMPFSKDVIVSGNSSLDVSFKVAPGLKQR